MDNAAFLFSATDPRKYPVTYNQTAVYHLDNEGPSFFDVWFQMDFSDNIQYDRLGKHFGVEETSYGGGDLCCTGIPDNGIFPGEFQYFTAVELYVYKIMDECNCADGQFCNYQNGTDNQCVDCSRYEFLESCRVNEDLDN